MKNLIILGGGTAGTIMANKMSKVLHDNWNIQIIDKDENHYYQPGFLFVPFGIYEPGDIVRNKQEFYPERVEFIIGEAAKIQRSKNSIVLKDGREYNYNVLIVATGCDIAPEETPQLKGKLWYKDIFDFYTFEGAVRLRDKLANWPGGKLVINLAETTIKCPVAPLEFAFLADDYFQNKGMRDQVEIFYVTPLSGAFTKPKATKMLSNLLEEKGITVVPDFYLQEIDEEQHLLRSYDGQEQEFDLLVSVPVNKGAEVIEASDMADTDGLRFVPTDKYTLQSKVNDNIFVIGDATNVPASKAGSVAHFEADILVKNIMDYITGKPLSEQFDGHSNCFIETGHGKAALIDFNYTTEPLPGKFPFPVVGPMDLLKESRLNHMGKLAFKWVYWNLLLTGKPLPVPNHMSMSGKITESEIETIHN